MKDDVTVRRGSYDDAVFKKLVSLLDRELEGRYGEEQKKLNAFNVIKENASVVIIEIDGEAVGCGSFRPMELTTSMEIKRMFVLPSLRSKGLAKIILKALEDWGKELGFTSAFLETGVKQPEAIAAYQKAGYLVIDNYGPYVGSKYSVCMRKDL